MATLRNALSQAANDMPSGWQLVAPFLSDIDPVARDFLRDTFATRIRTNSLRTEWVSRDQTDFEATSALEMAIRNAMRTGSPFSLIRLGDGEGGVLAGLDDGLVGAVYRRGGKYDMTAHEYADIRHQLREACDNADVLGLPREDMMDSAQYQAAITSLNEAARQRLVNGSSILTDCHCHYALHDSGAIERLVSEAGQIGYVGGRDISSHLSGIEVRQYRVPVQIDQGARDERPHFPDHYNHLVETISVPKPGALFLVAAGVLGKLYCDLIKRRGGVAVDIGAVADLWTGQRTRPYILRNYAPGETATRA